MDLGSGRPGCRPRRPWRSVARYRVGVQADRDPDVLDPEELTPRQRRLQRIAAYEQSSYGQRARTVQREAKERQAVRTRELD